MDIAGTKFGRPPVVFRRSSRLTAEGKQMADLNMKISVLCVATSSLSYEASRRDQITGFLSSSDRIEPTQRKRPA